MLCVDPALSYALLHGDLSIDACRCIVVFMQRHLLAYIHPSHTHVSVHVVNLETGHEEFSMINHHQSIVGISMHYPYLYLSALHGSISVLHVPTRQTLFEFPALMHSVTILQCIAHTSHYTLLGSGFGLNLFVWHVWPAQKIKRLRYLLSHDDIIEDMTAAGAHAATTAQDFTICVWQIEQGQLLYKLAGCFGSYITMAPSGQYLSGIMARERWCIWDLQTGHCVAEQSVMDDTMQLHFHPTQRRVLGVQKDLRQQATIMYDWDTTALLPPFVHDSDPLVPPTPIRPPRVWTWPDVVCDAVWLQRGAATHITCRQTHDVYNVV